MRILMVVRNGVHENPYVLSLVDGLLKYGHDVVCGLEEFWNSFENYDLLYFQWPEAIFDGRINQFSIEKLAMHFDRIKAAGVKTVITCHNLHPHNNDELTTDLYDFVYSKVDAFHHMGRYSYAVMRIKYPDRFHFIAPHHIPDRFWENPVYPAEAKRRLHIPLRSIVVSSFGTFRHDEEVQLYVDMAKDISNRETTFLAPRIPVGCFYNGRHIERTMKYLSKRFYYKRIGIKYFGFLTEEEQKVWLSASDVIFIQRKEILNSGNLPLAFSAGKVVVGPDLGNVGGILKETGNFVFNPQDRISIRQAVLDAINEVKRDNQLGIRNYHYAKEKWSVSRVCGMIDKKLSRIVNY